MAVRALEVMGLVAILSSVVEARFSLLSETCPPCPCTDAPSSPSQPSMSPTPSPSVSPPGPSNEGTAPKAPDDFCKWKGATGRFANVADRCQSYYWCVGPKQTYLMPCAAGLRWNEALQSCDFANKVPCPGAPSDSSDAGSGLTNPHDPPRNTISRNPPNPPANNTFRGEGPQEPSTPSSGPKYLGVTKATYHYYAPGYDVKTLYCADKFAGKSEEYLRRYGWTAYCLPAMRMTQELCGQCLRLTNVRTQHQETVRIVDQCGHNALDLDWDISFKSLDTDGQGFLDGHLNLSAELVAC